MLRGVPFKDSARATEYFSQALVKEDYWSKDAFVAGMWHGKIAERIGLSGEVKGDAFKALSTNRNPITGEKLTLRDSPGRVVGMDMSFSVPKSVSILYAFSGDQDIIDALEKANQKMMESIEREAKSQIWVDGQNHTIEVGEILYASFLHHTSRPVGGIPDPQLHTHNFIFNVTWNEEKQRYQALKWRGFKQNAPYHEAVARSWLAYYLMEAGYDIRKVGKAFEIKGIDRAFIEKYSRRSIQIDEIIAKRGIKEAKAKAQVGALSRESKSSSMSPQQTIQAWVSRATDNESQIVQGVFRSKGAITPAKKAVSESVDFALNHCFAKASVVKTRDLFREAVAHSYTSYLTADEIATELGRRKLIKGDIRGVEHCTSPRVLDEERQIMDFVRNGKGQFLRFHTGLYHVKRTFLSSEQKQAVNEILNSKNQVIGLQGGAGVGKTTLMQEVVEAIQSRGKQVFAFAPTNGAVETLKKDGFSNATTLQSLLLRPDLQEQLKGQVIWVDEAGLIGDEPMLKLAQIAGSNTRVIISGDINQHSPVERGKPFQNLQQFGVLRCSKVKTIIRQDEGYYREAAQAIANGDVDAAFACLQAMGAINEIPNSRELYAKMAKHYLAKIDDGETPLLISPSHSEIGKINAAIRKQLTEQKKLGASHLVERLINLNWTEVENTRAEYYKSGQVVDFHQNGKGGIIRGSQFLVEKVTDEGKVLVADHKGKMGELDLAEAKKFTVFKKREMDLAKGDLIRMTMGGKFPDGRRYKNGQTYEISRIYPSGSIKLKNGALLKGINGVHISYGYVKTSHSTQSKTEKSSNFLIQSERSNNAASLNQFLVSITRGKSEIHLYTQSSEDLKTAVRNKEHILSATEFAQDRTSMNPQDRDNIDHTPNNDPKKTPLTAISGKQRDAVFNSKGEYHFSPGFVRHDVGGSFQDYVKERRSGLSGFVGDVESKRKNQEQGLKKPTEKQTFSKREAIQKSKGITSISAKQPGETQKNWLDKVRSNKVNLGKDFQNRRSEIISATKKNRESKIGDPATEKKIQTSKAPISKGANVGGKNLGKKKNAPTTAKSISAVKGKGKGKTAPPPAKKKTAKKAPPPPPVRKK